MVHARAIPRVTCPDVAGLAAKSRLIRTEGIVCWTGDPDNKKRQQEIFGFGGFGTIHRGCMFILFSFARSLSGSRRRRLCAAPWTEEQPGLARLCAETDQASQTTRAVHMTIRQQPPFAPRLR